jgi:hypothetical protein
MTEALMDYHEKKFEFEDRRYPMGAGSFCQVDVYVPTDWKDRGPCALVVMSDPGRDSGVSVTNASEAIAQKIFKEILEPKFPEMNPALILWVERYPRGVGREYETLDKVQYAHAKLKETTVFTQPKWKAIRVADVLKAFPGAGVAR